MDETIPPKNWIQIKPLVATIAANSDGWCVNGTNRFLLSTILLTILISNLIAKLVTCLIHVLVNVSYNIMSLLRN